MKAMFRMVTMSGIKTFSEFSMTKSCDSCFFDLDQQMKTFIDVNENSFLKKWKCNDNT